MSVKLLKILEFFINGEWLFFVQDTKEATTRRRLNRSSRRLQSEATRISLCTAECSPRTEWRWSTSSKTILPSTVSPRFGWSGDAKTDRFLIVRPHF